MQVSNGVVFILAILYGLYKQLKGHVDEWLAEDADQLAMG